MRTAKKTDTQELGLREMLKKIRENHIDIVPIIQEELNVVIMDYIQDIVKGVYDNLE